jgi:acyl-coenzyme A thioesterase PaaI-like protein
MASAATQLRQAWASLSTKPAGKQLFSFMFGKMVPYTGTIGAQVVELRPGYAKMVLRDRKQVRNHLNSVHAIALANLGEATSGLAMNFGLPDDARAIVVKLGITYSKKARGPITAECKVEIPDFSVQQEHAIDAVMTDASGDEVARLTATWLVGPRPRD